MTRTADKYSDVLANILRRQYARTGTYFVPVNAVRPRSNTRSNTRSNAHSNTRSNARSLTSTGSSAHARRNTRSTANSGSGARLMPKLRSPTKRPGSRARKPIPKRSWWT